MATFCYFFVMDSPLINRWKQAWNNHTFRLTAITLAFILPGALSAFRMFLNYVEQRPGIILDDPLLPFLAPTNLTWITFALIYGGLLSAVAILVAHPRLLLRMVSAYIILLIIRTGCLYAVPLEPPPGTIPLTDPLVEFFGSSGTTLTRDLFFSGHTATLFLFGLGIPGHRWSTFFLAATAAVAVCVLWQHVHYTIDVLAAPLAAWASFRISGWLMVVRGIQ